VDQLVERYWPGSYWKCRCNVTRLGLGRCQAIGVLYLEQAISVILI
jgi:hypothetical protein